MRESCLSRRLGLGLAMLLAAGCVAWPASKLKVVRVRKVPPIGPPVWRVDLRAFGYADHVEQLWKTPAGATLTTARGGSVFVDQHTLLVTFVRRVPGKMASRDQLHETSPLRLQGVFFQTDSGRVVAQRDWGMSSPGSYVLTAYNGRFVLGLEQKLVLYSSALEPLKELELPPSGKLSKVGSQGVFRSPSGRTISLIHRQGGQFDYHVFDAETLSALESWSAPAMQFPTVADDKLAVEYIREDPHHLVVTSPRVEDSYPGEGIGFVWEGVAVGRVGGAWTVVCKGRCGSPIFVNNDVLAFWGDVDLWFIRADGQPLSPKFRIGEYGAGRGDAIIGDMLRASAQGERLAVPLFLVRPYIGGHPHMCDLVRVLVFDLPSGQWIGALEASQYKIERICYPALSPDGALLALFRQEGLVEVYRLPASPAAPQAK